MRFLGKLQEAASMIERGRESIEIRTGGSFTNGELEKGREMKVQHRGPSLLTGTVLAELQSSRLIVEIQLLNSIIAEVLREMEGQVLFKDEITVNLPGNSK
ncbi:hypothetical protein ACLB2K_004654 [Fragaria x ananassa]